MQCLGVVVQVVDDVVEDLSWEGRIRHRSWDRIYSLRASVHVGPHYQRCRL